MTSTFSKKNVAKHLSNVTIYFAAFVDEILDMSLPHASKLTHPFHLTRAPTGGGGYPPPPLRFIPDSVKTAARSGAKFGMTIPTFIAHISLKL